MSEFERLDMGFVNWQGQRLFVPSFGAPRIVPASDDEVRMLRAQFGMDVVLAVYVAALFAAAIWLSAYVRIGMFALASTILVAGIPGILVIFGILQRRCYGRWPLHSTSRFSRFYFMLSYFRKTRMSERLFELFWGLAGVLLFVSLPSDMVEGALAGSAGISSSARLVLLGTVSSIGLFRATRHSLIVALALTPWVGRLAKFAG